MQPGETITPGAVQPPAPEPEKQDQPVVDGQATQPQPATPPAVATPEPATAWQFSPEGGEPLPNNDSQALLQQTTQPVTWNASEFIAHTKGLSWFAALGIGLFVFTALIYFISRDIFASVMIAVAGITFGVFAARPPRVLEYSVDARGINIGQKSYTYSDFKSFAVVEDGPLPAVMLLPLKRFLPPITVFYEPKQEDAILNVIADYLPHEEKQPDVVDRLMSRIRF